MANEDLKFRIISNDSYRRGKVDGMKWAFIWVLMAVVAALGICQLR